MKSKCIGLAVAFLMLVTGGCSKNKSINPVAPEGGAIASSQATATTVTWVANMQEAYVTYDTNSNITKVVYAGYHWGVTAITNSVPCTVYPAFSTIRDDLTSTSRPGRKLTLGFAGGQIVYIVDKGPADAIFCYTIDSYYPVYDGSVLHQITNYTMPVQKAEWKLNNNTTDATGHGNNGTIVNGVSFVQGGSGYAASFNGANYINIPSVSNFNNMSAFTLTAWIKPIGYNSVCNAIISKVNPNRDFVFQVNGSGKLNAHFAINYNEYHQCTSDQTIPLNQWTFVAAVWTGTKWQLYINNTLVKEADGGGKVPAWTGARLGIGTLNNIYDFKGLLDDVMVIPSALTASQLSMVYQSGVGHTSGNY